MDEPTRRLGILLVVLRFHLAYSLGLIVLAMIGGAFLLDFIQLPGGLWDAAASGRSETHARAVALHLLYTASLATFLASIRRRPAWRPAAAMAHAVAGVLTVPFGAVLGALAGWRRDADWEAADHYAASVAGRSRIGLFIAWGLVLLVSSSFAFAAYVTLLSGNGGWSVPFLVVALASQAGGLWFLIRMEPRTRIKTYGSPFPEMPEWRAKDS